MKCEVFKAEDFKGYFLTPKTMADECNRLLMERGQMMYSPDKVDAWAEFRIACDRRQALLIAVQPIEKPDTAEGLLREILEGQHHGDWRARVKKFLDSSKG